MTEYLSFIVILAGLSSGAFIGATLATDTERKKRPNAGKLKIFLESVGFGAMFNMIISTLIGAAIFILICMSILHAGDAYPLTQEERYSLTLSLLFGAAFAKWLRYIYWVKKA